MPFYTTAISKLVESDLQELVTDQAVENLRLEFKSTVPSEDQTLKKLSSLANTYGGIVIVGAEEKDGKITNLCGVPLQPGYKQTLANWCFMKFSPPLTAEFSEPIKLANGQYCYVISVPESDVAPHFVNGRKGVWIRTDEFSNRFRAELANENELRALFDRRKAVRERRDFNIQRARERFAAHIATMHTDMSGHLGDVGPIFELCVTPRFPARQLCLHGDLQPHVSRAAFHLRGVQFLGNDSHPITAFESVIIRDALHVGGTSIFSTDIWGTCYYATQIATEEKNIAGQNVTGIHRAAFNGFVMSFLLHAARMLKSLGCFGPLLVRISLKSIRGMHWLYSTGSAVWDKIGSELDKEISFELPSISESFCSDPYTLGAVILETVFYSTNWSDLVDTPKKRQEIVEEGFRYNRWATDPPKP